MTFAVIRFACAAIGAAIVVPCVAIGIQTSAISVGNGNGLSIMAAVAGGVSALPLALLAVPLNAIAACLLGAFSLGAERLLERRSIFIWLFHGLAIGCVSLIVFHSHRIGSIMIVAGAVGSWLFGALVMRSFFSARTTSVVSST